MVELLIGAPSWKRAWIIPQWLQFAFTACEEARISPEFFLQLDPRDGESADVFLTTAAALGAEAHVHWQEEEDPGERNHNWNAISYQYMTDLRNNLLRHVREIQPEYFLSVDTDILLHPRAVERLFDSIQSYDAVGGKTFMSPYGLRHPSYGHHFIGPNGYVLIREEAPTHVMPVDVIMAIKMMTPEAYNIDYEWHIYGEDIGWCYACKRAGLAIGWDGRCCSKHVMRPELLVYDERCGF